MSNKNVIDVDAILKEYGEEDFGFSVISEEEYNAVVNEVADTAEEYKKRLEAVEKIIIPFLTKLLKTADQPIIKWPNRGPVIKEQIEKKSVVKKSPTILSTKIKDTSSFISLLEAEMQQTKEIEKVEKLKEEEFSSFISNIKLSLNQDNDIEIGRAHV